MNLTLAMSKFLKVAAAALNQTPLDWDRNRQNIQYVISKARKQNVQILCLPELCLSGYGCEDAFYAAYVHKAAWYNLKMVLPYTADIAVAIGLPILYNARIYNTMALVVDQKIYGLVAKAALAKDGVHYEPRWFTPWAIGQQSFYKNLPLGSLVFEIMGLRIGFEICEDAWRTQRPANHIATNGLDLICNPSASHFSFGKPQQRLQYILDSSRRFACAYIYANLLGNEAGRLIYDGSAIIAQTGECLAHSDSFSFQDYQLTTAILDLDQIRHKQRLRQVGEPFDPASQVQSINYYFKYSTATLTDIRQDVYLTQNHYDDFLKAVALGLFDYMRKSYTQSLTISLSGGMDSSTVLVIAYFMIQMALKELGLEGFKTKLSHIEKLQDCNTLDLILKNLITTVYQATAQNSSTTFQAAQSLAKTLGVTFYHLDIENICQAYIQNAERCFGRTLAWEKDDVALQNIQARARSPQVWLLANLTNSLLLTTSNRSEIALGYCTMDGDTSGGLAPIGGVDKLFVCNWLKWVETEKGIPALSLVNTQEPTAELRPLQDAQTDEKDLMPYELLNQIEALACRDKLSPKACYERLKPYYEVETLKHHIDTFFTLWQQTQWKRERYAVSFHLDDRNLDPKTWCRYPILSGRMKT